MLISMAFFPQFVYDVFEVENQSLVQTKIT